MNLSTNYNKLFILIATVILAVGPQILGQAGDLGITPVIANWLTIGLATLGAIVHLAVPNANQPTLPPGNVIVPSTQIQPGAVVKFSRPSNGGAVQKVAAMLALFLIGMSLLISPATASTGGLPDATVLTMGVWLLSWALFVLVLLEVARRARQRAGP